MAFGTTWILAAGTPTSASESRVPGETAITSEARRAARVNIARGTPRRISYGTGPHSAQATALRSRRGRPAASSCSFL